MSKRKLSLQACLGMGLGMAFIVGSVLVSGHVAYFWNLPSAFITIGGTSATIIMAFPPKNLKTFFSVIRSAFIDMSTDPLEDIEIIVGLSKEARFKGVMALEELAPQYKDDKFLYEGILMIADGVTEEELRGRLEGIIYFLKQRHSKGAAMMDMVAATAPSLGLLGTYVGLIPMLHSLDDPSSLGPMMALELVSSFYGAFIAYILFSPIAKRLRTMGSEEDARNEMILEGLSGIQQGKNPSLIESELLAFMNLKRDKDRAEKLGGKRRGRSEAA